ncbi:hypothetical protein HK100_007116, partial [Physocladia obscura]
MRPTNNVIRQYQIEIKNLFKEPDEPKQYNNKSLPETYKQNDTSEEEEDLGIGSEEESDIEIDNVLDIQGLVEVME